MWLSVVHKIRMDHIKGVHYPGVSVIFFCHDGKGSIVMSKRTANCRDEHGHWDIGGGSIDQGHTVEQTLRKEIMEEYCTDVLEYEFLGYRDVHREHAGVRTHWIALDFKVLVDSVKVRNGEPHKSEEVRWFRRDELPADEFLHSQFPYFLEKYKDKL